MTGDVVSGVWERRLAGRRLRVTVTPAARLSAGHRQLLGQEAERLASFAGARPDLVLDEPD
ncbi:MAG TPA: hypothetical protein VHF26_22590 [Trebonia sp.]|nr:hypothetical protein [Trebonia sp.]